MPRIAEIVTLPDGRPAVGSDEKADMTGDSEADETRYGILDNDCEGQAVVPTEFCQTYTCDSVPLVVDAFGCWKCPKCSANYGKAAKG